MPTIGWFEILLIVAIAIIVVGPKDFPIMLKKVGSWIGTLKRYINDIQSEVTNLESETKYVVENIIPIILKNFNFIFSRVVNTIFYIFFVIKVYIIIYLGWR